MNDCTMPHAIPLHRPFWQRLWEDSQAWLTRRGQPAPDAESALSLQAAIELNDKTLRDIGAPEWLRDQAAAHRDHDSLMLRAARADLGGGGLRWL
jgi:hypothetical protein